MPTFLEWDGSDTDEAFHWVGVRMAVGVAILLGYLMHFAIITLGYLPQLNREGKICKDTLKCIQKRMFLFGLAGLISITPLQGNFWCGIWSYFTLVSLVLVHLTPFPFLCTKDKANLKSIIFIVHYLCLTFWISGTVFASYHISNSEGTGKEPAETEA